jgi:glycosyltransferase involved in cell wall biosynthesis
MIHQEYKGEIEWVIVEDGEQDVRSLLVGLPPHIVVKYVRLDGKHPIGKKRNVCLDEASGDVLLFHDDDDYYQPSHISHSVEALTGQSAYGVAGCSLLVVWRQGAFYVSGRAGQNDSPSGVMCFTRKAVKQYRLRFRDTDTHAEEAFFLKDFRVPILHLDPRKTIIAIQHGGNTWNCEFDESKTIEYEMPQEVLALVCPLYKIR